MKLVVDTNVLIAALMKESAVRELLLNPFFEFYVPEHCFEEIERHVCEMSERSGLSVDDVFLLLGVLMASVQVVPAERVLKAWKEAVKVMSGIDEGDVPFVALALSFENDGIWSEDTHFLKQRRVRVWRTEDLVKLLKKQT